MSRPRRRGKRWVLSIALVLLVLLLTFGSLVYAEPGVFSSLTKTLVRSPSTATAPATATAIVTLTPTSNDLKKTYTIAAVTGTPDLTQHQVGARQISVTTQAQTKKVNATGSKQTPGTQAQGTLTAINQSCQTAYYPVGSIFIGSDGIKVVNDAVINLPDSCPNPTVGQVTVPSHTVNAGSQYNIQRDDIHLLNDICSCGNESCPTITADVATNIALTDTFAGAVVSPQMPSSGGGWWLVCNVNPFTGGQDGSSQTAVQQSDIDGAANALESAYSPDPQQALQGQIHANEHFVGTPICNPNVSHDHNAGDAATTVTVTVTFTCTGQVYDQQGALTMAQQWLKQDAVRNPGPNYMLMDTIATTQGQAQVSNTDYGTILIPVTAEGVWVYQFSSAQEQAIAKQIAGKKKAVAQTLLQQRGVAHANIEISGGDGTTLPVDSRQIRFVILSVNGK